MNSNLDQPIENFRSQLHQVADMVADLYTDIENQPVYGNPDPEKVRDIFKESLPSHGLPIINLLRKIQKDVFPNSTKHYSPHFYPWVTSCASQASIIGDFLATALNVNSTTWMNSAASSEIERQVIKWIGQFSGYDNDASGVLLSGGSTANKTGLQIARYVQTKGLAAAKGLKFGQQLTVYASEQTHFCIDKSVDAMGIGKEYLRKIKTHTDFTLDVHELEDTVLEDLQKGYKPLCIVGNVGTVSTGAIDPLNKLAELSKKYEMWFHVDAAYGGCAANLDTTGSLFQGFDKANSVAIDLHKWFFVPFEAGCILVKDKNQLKQIFSVVPDIKNSIIIRNYKLIFQNIVSNNPEISKHLRFG